MWLLHCFPWHYKVSFHPVLFIGKCLSALQLDLDLQEMQVFAVF